MTDEVKISGNNQSSTNTPPNDSKNNQAQNPLLPPLSWTDKDPDPHDPYDYVKTDIPTEQTILIYLNHAQAGYLPHAATVDESGHIVPADIYNRKTRERVLPIAILRQGEASGVTFNFKILDETGRTDLSDFYMLRFQGRTSQYNFVSSDEGFDTTQMSLGEFKWKPEEAVGLVSGKYVSAQIVLERQDRTTRSISLDFDLHIIPNNVAYPRPMAFYVSEYHRALANFKRLQDLADEHTGYTLDFFDNVITDALLADKKRIDEALADFENKLSIENQKLIDLDTSFQNLKQKEIELSQQIEQKNLVTKENFSANFNAAVQSGDINLDNKIQDDNVKAEIDRLYETAKSEEVKNDSK
ncbi:hypothetical protein DS831_04745 [Bombilactobacillus bombi]|uniref:BppU N-terminal domain-containing protein n=1 Tax=Bombilactobacillus bombi TaxID=1303590 RepID=A0A417ZIB1_9LACO|nr:hypothetical protein [Bombilactobacillus bombi]RHW51333.1 hypothetical protein DS831_04745 [Bombilactobacillus bombi]